MNLFDIFESEDELFAESPKAKILAILHDAKEGRQRALVRMLKDGDYPEAQIVAKEQAMDGIDAIAQALKFGGVTPAAKEWNRIFYAKAYSGEPGAAELSDEGLDIAYTIKDEAGPDFFRLSGVLGESIEDDMFANRASTVRLPEIVEDFTYNALKMMERPEEFLQQELGIDVDDLPDEQVNELIDQCQAGGDMMEAVAETFKNAGIVAGLQKLKDMFNNPENDVASTAAILALEEFQDVYDIDPQQYLSEEDDMFADPWRITVASLLSKLLSNPAAQRRYEIEQDDLDDIPLLVDALRTNNMNRAKSLWDYFSWNELDVALDKYITRSVPGIELFELLGDEDDLEESDDMFAPASKSSIATAAKRNIVGKVAAKGRVSRKTDTELQEIVEIAQQVFGRKYSSGTISGGKVYRISLITRGLEGMYHYNSMANVSKNDKIILGEQKKKFFDILAQRGLDTSRVDVKYHIAAFLYTSVRIKMKPEELAEEDDEMFAPPKYRADLTKINSAMLRQLYQNFTTDIRPEYASKHRQMSARIAAELERRGEHMPVNEEDDMFSDRAALVPDNWKKYIGLSIIGSARIRNDIESVMDWRDLWQVDSIEELPLFWRKLFQSAGRTVPLIDLDQTATYAVFYIAPGLPMKLNTMYLRDIKADHPMAVDESEDDMFAELNVAKKLGRIMLQKGYHLGSLSMENVKKELDLHPELVKQLSKQTKLNYDHPQVMWDVFDGVIFEFEENLQRQRNMNESDDDMFASAFRVERDTMDWQQKAKWAAIDFLGFGTKGIHLHKDDANNIIYMYQLQDNGDCTGVFYSPQPATIETNIGTYNPKFKGSFEQYLAADPNNPLKNLKEEDDMFASAASPLKKAKELLDRFKSVYIQIPYYKNAIFPVLGIFVDNRSWHENIKDTVTFTRGWQVEDMDVNGNDLVLSPYENGFVLKPKETGKLAEEDDMFASNTLTDEMGDNLIRYARVLYGIAAERKMEQLSKEGELIAEVGQLFKNNGLVAGARAYRRLDDKTKSDIQSLFQQVLGFDINDLIGQINETDEWMFSQRPQPMGRVEYKRRLYKEVVAYLIKNPDIQGQDVSSFDDILKYMEPESELYGRVKAIADSNNSLLSRGFVERIVDGVSDINGYSEDPDEI